VELLNFVALVANVFAFINVCTPACTDNPSATRHFQMFTEMVGDYLTHSLSHSTFATDPSLDVTPLTHQNVTVVSSQNDSVRTRTWQYSAFAGRIFLGNFAAGQTFSVHYGMQASAANGNIIRGYFPASDTWAAAAINDPFFLSSDPLPQQLFLSLEFVPSNGVIPEPATVGGIAAGLGLLAVLRRRASFLRRRL